MDNLQVNYQLSIGKHMFKAARYVLQSNSATSDYYMTSTDALVGDYTCYQWGAICKLQGVSQS